jgi:hypothetical protein
MDLNLIILFVFFVTMCLCIIYNSKYIINYVEENFENKM